MVLVDKILPALLQHPHRTDAAVEELSAQVRLDVELSGRLETVNRIYLATPELSELLVVRLRFRL